MPWAGLRRFGGAAACWLLLACCGCYDPVPGTIHLHTTVDGQPHGCLVQVFNAQGRQVQQDGVNDGHVDIENLAPGTYTLKFQGFEQQLYPAQRTVKLFEAGEVDLTVELTSAADNGPASADSAGSPAAAEH
jgi:hypothetical protein